MDEIEIIKQKLIEQVNPICIYLFGSFARGTAHVESDLDFYIIVDDGEKDLHAIAASAYKAIRDVKQRPGAWYCMDWTLTPSAQVCPWI